jgi:hypothetical protein
MSRTQLMRLGLGLAGCLLACSAMSCRSGGSANCYPVSGEVMVDGKPLPMGSVTLYADSGKGNTSKEVPVGEIKEGRYEIFTGKRRGAPLGVYKVIVVSGDKVPQPTGGTAELPKSLIDTKYGDPKRTPLVVEVVERPPPGAYDLKVTK